MSARHDCAGELGTTGRRLPAVAMSSRAWQRSRSRHAPSAAPSSVASQHAASSDASRSAPQGAQSGCVSQPAAELADTLKDEVLQWTYQSFIGLMKDVCKKSTEERPTLDRDRIQQIQQKTFSSTTNTLHRAYQKLLHVSAEAGCTDSNIRNELAANVRDLADAIHHKFSTNSPANATEGKRQVALMLEHLMVEKVWSMVAAVHRQAMEQAEDNAQKAYERSKDCRIELSTLRHAVP